jgi:sigma-E factor negative regulatory protein RseC
MESTHNIEHEGIVVSISDRKIVVKIMAQSACSGCHAKGACSAADLQDKLVDIVPDGQSYQTGQRVIISGHQSLGFKAVLYAYVIPSVLVIGALMGAYTATGNDVASAIIALICVALYYGVIYMFRSRLQKTFTFTIKNQFS